MYSLISFGVLAALNLVTTRMTLPYDPSSRLGRVVRFLEDEGLKQNAGPSVIFIGSSRFQSFIVPDVFYDFADKEGIHARFINLAQPDMYIWEFSKILTRTDLSAIDPVVCTVEVNPWTFNRQRLHTVTKEVIRSPQEFENWSTLGELLEVDDINTRVKLIAKAALPRRSLVNWVKAFHGFCVDKPEVPELPVPPYHLSPDREIEIRNDSYLFPENVSRCQMVNYEFNEKKRDFFLRFLDDLKMKGMEIVVVQPPVKDSYFEYIRENPERERHYEKHKEFIRELSQRYLVLVWQTSDSAGFDESIFVDYGHFTKDSAIQFSQLLLSKMRREIERLKPSREMQMASLR